MGKIASFLSGAALAAAYMYYFDPKEGNRRRALLQDKLRHLTTVAEQRGRGACQDIGNRLHGLAAELQGRLHSVPVSDDVLIARVRAHMGHVVSHSSAISVSARAGRVTLSGPVPADEAKRLLASTAAVRGVKGVEDQLLLREPLVRLPGLPESAHAPAR